MPHLVLLNFCDYNNKIGVYNNNKQIQPCTAQTAITETG